MKKIFTLIAAALMVAGGVKASTVTIWEPEDGNPVLLEWGKPNVQINNVEVVAGDVITLTVSSVDKSIDGYPQATMCTSVGDSWDWTELENQLTSAAGAYNFTVTEDMLEKIQSHNQIFFKGTAAYISKVELTSAADVDVNQLWSGDATAIGWNDNIKVSATKMANAKVGDKLEISVSNFQSGHQLLMHYDWGKYVPGSRKGVFVDGDAKYTVGITKAFLEQVKSTGFFVGGAGVDVSEIRLIPEDNDYDNVIYAGDIELSSSRNGVEIYGVSEVGDDVSYLQVMIEGTPAWLQIADKNWSKIEVTPTVSENVYEYELTSELKSNLADFIVQGEGFTLKQIKLSSIPTGISQVKDDKAADNNTIYNLAGQKVDKSYKGIVIKNGKKYIGR